MLMQAAGGDVAGTLCRREMGWIMAAEFLRHRRVALQVEFICKRKEFLTHLSAACGHSALSRFLGLSADDQVTPSGAGTFFSAIGHSRTLGVLRWFTPLGSGISDPNQFRSQPLEMQLMKS